MQKLALYILIYFVVNTLTAQVAINVTTDKLEYEIGDYIRVEITASSEETIAYFWPAVSEIAPYEVIAVNPIDTVTIAGETVYKQKIIFSIYEPDKYYFPQVTIPYKKPNDNTAYFAISDSLPFIVKSIAVDTTAIIKPIKVIQDVKVVNFTPLYIFLVINAIIAVAFIIYFFFIRKEKKSAIAKPLGQQKSLYELTIDKLNVLNAKKLWQKDELKLYYSELTDILRSYIEQRFAINAMESTSDEILEQCNNIVAIKPFTDDITFILQLADMAKFAKSRPLPNENVKAMELASQFVELTKPIEPTANITQ